MCTIGDFNKALNLTPDDAVILFNGGYSDELEDEDVNKNRTPKVIFYTSLYHTINSLEHINYIVCSVINKIICIIPRKYGKSFRDNPTSKLARLSTYSCRTHWSKEWEHYSHKIRKNRQKLDTTG